VEILMLMIPFSVVLVLGIGALFWWSVDNGQFDDLEGPAQRVLADNDSPPVPSNPDLAVDLTHVNPEKHLSR
jgi:cbb3-type cytochrome oxidase maturation protein